MKIMIVCINNNLSNKKPSKMKNYLLSLYVCMSLVIWIECRASEQLTYTVSDINIIPHGSYLELSNSLIPQLDDEQNEGQIDIIQNFTQIVGENSSYISYNILFFNLHNSFGRQCYFNYFEQSTFPTDPSNTSACSNMQQQINNLSNYCVNYTNCTNQNFTYLINLQQISFLQFIVLIQNNEPPIDNQTSLTLQMQATVSVYNSNEWFYWSVALTCFLLLSLVFLTGIVLYWSLRYRKAQRALEELRLTEADEADSIRKSLRKNLKDG